MTDEFGTLEEARAALRDGRLRGTALTRWIESRPAQLREAAVERLLGTDTDERPPTLPASGELLGYHASGVDAVLQLIREVPIARHDVFVDIGAGLGKVTLLVHLITGARAVGLERDPALVALARSIAKTANADGVSYVEGDARETMPEGSVYFLYLPFVGTALAAAMVRLERMTRGRDCIVCTLGLDLSHLDWLCPRPSSGFWTSVYERAERAI